MAIILAFFGNYPLQNDLVSHFTSVGRNKKYASVFFFNGVYPIQSLKTTWGRGLQNKAHLMRICMEDNS